MFGTLGGATDLGRRVYDRDELTQVARYQRVVERPVLVTKALEERILGEIVCLRVELVVRAIALLVESVDAMGKPAGQPESCSLYGGKAGSYTYQLADSNDIRLSTHLC